MQTNIFRTDEQNTFIFRNVTFPWGNEDTNDLLSILAKHNIKTTFFMTGGWVESYPEDVIWEITVKITSRCPS